MPPNDVFSYCINIRGIRYLTDQTSLINPDPMVYLKSLYSNRFSKNWKLAAVLKNYLNTDYSNTSQARIYQGILIHVIPNSSNKYGLKSRSDNFEKITHYLHCTIGSSGRHSPVGDLRTYRPSSYVLLLGPKRGKVASKRTQKMRQPKLLPTFESF